MVRLLKYFNYISYRNKLLLLNKNILVRNYYFILFPHFNIRTLRLNYLIKFNMLKYGLRFSFFVNINFLPFVFNVVQKSKFSSILYTKNVFKFNLFFKKIFSFISQQEFFIFRLGIYVKFANNFFDYNKFYSFLMSLKFITWNNDWFIFFNYFFIFFFNYFMIRRSYFFIFLNFYFYFYYILKRGVFFNLCNIFH